jgi:hypothetical protein
MAVKSHKHYAESFGISINTFRNWLKRGAPYQNKAKMITWLLNLQRLPEGAKEYLKDNGVNIAARSPRKSIKSGTTGLKDISDFRDYYREKLGQATEANDQDQVKFWSEQFLKTDESIRRSEAHAAKLGIDNGTVLPRAEVERIMRAVFYAGNACTQGVLTSICEQLVGYDDPGDLYHALKPAVTGGRLFSGFDKVSNVTGAPNIPSWVVDCVKLEAEQYLGNSESLWTRKLK